MSEPTMILLNPVLLSSMIKNLGLPTTCDIVNDTGSQVYELALSRTQAPGPQATITERQKQQAETLARVVSQFLEVIAKAKESLGDQFPESYGRLQSKLGSYQDLSGKVNVGDPLLDYLSGFSGFLQQNRGKLPQLVKDTEEHPGFAEKDQILKHIQAVLSAVLGVANVVVRDT